MKVAYPKEIYQLASDLNVIEGKLDTLSNKEAHANTDFRTHKAMNVAFKELDCIRMLLLSISGEKQFNKTALRNMIKMQEISIAQLQSWTIYLR